MFFKHSNPAPQKGQHPGTPSKVEGTPKSTHQHAATGSRERRKERARHKTSGDNSAFLV